MPHLGDVLKVIPVLDLLNEQVVHAKFGNRQHYQPIQSTICRGSDPFEILSSLIALYRCDTCYIADLNSIQNIGNHIKTISELVNLHPDIQFWIDGGGKVEYISELIKLGVKPIVGSESIRDIDDYKKIQLITKNQHVLSLDFKNQKFIGNPDLIKIPELWPEDVIVMTLDLVGSNLGPNLERLLDIRSLKENCNIFAAGGVRNIADLLALKDSGVNGALIASALHSGAINGNQCGNLATTHAQ
jgi:phosphoribosylformimino-5-aminoimidazole carboxamide ribotide isomerase